jgi:hypothetical protein
LKRSKKLFLNLDVFNRAKVFWSFFFKKGLLRFHDAKRRRYGVTKPVTPVSGFPHRQRVTKPVTRRHLKLLGVSRPSGGGSVRFGAHGLMTTVLPHLQHASEMLPESGFQNPP